MLTALALALLLLQDAPPPLPPPPDAPKAEAPLVDVDGDPLAPGKLPRSTAPEARKAWERLVAASLASAAGAEPVRGFDLSLDLRLRVRENQTNDLPEARYAYVAPGYLIADTGRGRTHLRGPQGDWLVDSKADTGRTLVRLDVGRENAEDRRQIAEALDVARLFVGLVDPRNVRVQKLAPAAVPEALLPAQLLETARKLAWLELQTPDVRPGTDNKVGARILLGLAADSGLPALALADDARAPQRLNPTASCVDLQQWKPMDGYSVPRKILVHLPRVVEAQGAGGATSRVAEGWRDEPAMDLFVRNGTLRPQLKPESFLPPAPEKVPAPAKD
jgi:hypothetical protein